MPGNGGDYKSQIAAYMAQMYPGYDMSTLSGAGMMPTAPGATQNPMLMGMMDRGPGAMARGPMAMVKGQGR